jgi:hypothetical protein
MPTIKNDERTAEQVLALLFEGSRDAVARAISETAMAPLFH